MQVSLWVQCSLGSDTLCSCFPRGTMGGTPVSLGSLFASDWPHGLMGHGEQGAFGSRRGAVSSNHYQGHGLEELGQHVVLQEEDAVSPRERKSKQAQGDGVNPLRKPNSQILDLNYDCFKIVRPDKRVYMCGAFLALIRFISYNSVENAKKEFSLLLSKSNLYQTCSKISASLFSKEKTH